jgi:pimeloyl-ACP methyl ester carboxylesterase
MGGKVAMTLALVQPDLVERLVVVDMAPAPSRATLLPFATAMRAIDPTGLQRRGEVDALLAPAVPDAGVRAFLLQNLVPADEGLRWRVNLDAVVADMDDIMGFPAFPADARYGGPTRFIAGERSPYLGPDDLELIRSRFPQAELDVVPDAGHWVHAEQPAAFLERLRAFLQAAA